jgi:hypothetical protein
MQNDAALGVLRRLDGGHRLGLLACGNLAEVLLQHRKSSCGIDVADDRNDDV